MNVAELIADLQTCPQDALVIQSKDAEGNGHSPVYELSIGLYDSDSTYSGEYYNADEDPSELPSDKLPTVVCIWPTN